MGLVVATCDGCGVRFRTARPEAASAGHCPKCHAPLAPAIARALAVGVAAANPAEPAASNGSTTRPEPAREASAVVQVVAGTSVVIDQPALAQPAHEVAAGRFRLRLAAGALTLGLALVLSVAWPALSSSRGRARSGSNEGASRRTAAVVTRPRLIPAPGDDARSPDDPPPAPSADEPKARAARTSDEPPPPPQPGTVPAAPATLALVATGAEGSTRNPLSELVGPPAPPSSVLAVPPAPRPESLHGAANNRPPATPVSPGQGDHEAQGASGHSSSKGHGQSQTQQQPQGQQGGAAAAKSGPLWKPDAPEPKRLLVVDNGQPMVCRELGEADGKLMVLLPSGEVGWVDGRSYTEKPFKPSTMDEMREALREGPYRNFQVRQTPHYLVFYRCTERFSADSANLLETLYQGLSKKLAENGIEVHDAEFPMVAVIYDTERAFRQANRVASDVQAYYHLLSNRIYFYETSSRDETSPEVSAIRKPQTIAHEGTHQILQNIGVQPRMTKWPLWLVEGLAEYWAPTVTRKGAVWAGGGHVNALHMATIRDMEDQELWRRSRGFGNPRIRDIHSPIVSYIVPRTDLSPTDYAIAWALTHYLATRRTNDFIDYLKTMSRMAPGQEPTPKDHLKMFREAFGDDLAKIDKAIYQHVGKLKYDPVPYYAVMCEREEGPGLVTKASLVSQSPTTIRQWLDGMQAEGLPVRWQAVEFPNKTPALQAADFWRNSR